MLSNRFNPLHCGAVVASGPDSEEDRKGRIVSIPFIAGQWSLRLYNALLAIEELGFNPLHCGAVVASPERRAPGARLGDRFQSPSLRGSGRFAPSDGCRPAPTPRFNPLHCGAVVASIVWIAAAALVAAFQSPSLRGSGRFFPRHAMAAENGRVSIPFIAGQWSLHGEHGARRRRGTRVSIPFIAGQWSLQLENAWEPDELHAFQSPSLRGSGRFLVLVLLDQHKERLFQSPSLRGSGRFARCGDAATV